MAALVLFSLCMCRKPFKPGCRNAYFQRSPPSCTLCPGRRVHWALVTGPKSEKPDELGERYHVKQRQMLWEFSEQEIRLSQTNMILVRVLIAKVKDKKKLKATLRNIPARPEVPGWTCKAWVKEAFEALKGVRPIS
ncbi:hypothetical protein QQS21_012841 [Conoideocrella luteorostrata]|uniref:Uncharacterized protein n=1 Tax=Conoideocrella luteorostrata TaxID=1105319 RepID=A0AAJ0FSB7_9HYPO|nr:hypothetical protein QQS21_012841 [Conoideocrella luteorostrata]